MKDPRTVFETMMRGNGFTDFRVKKNKHYVSPSLQTRWRYFLLGWEMRGLK